ncbi:MAG: hypothetical protein HY720_00560 [Planctomycetes bacterium]|nr:hypothetical protein [Planctomycetota bacterium]
MDTYIDNQETQKYGPKLRKNIEAAFKSAPLPVRTFTKYLIGLQGKADKTMDEAMTKARGASSDLSGAVLEKTPAAKAARKLLGGIQKHLAAKRDLDEWAGQIGLFFPKGMEGVGYSTPDLLAALRVAQEGFKKDKTVPDGTKLAKRVAAAEGKLKKEAESAGGALLSARSGLTEQSAEKKAWLRRYRGISKIVDGLLTLEGRAEKLASVVPHLAVPGGRKKKADTKSVVNGQ